MIPAYLSLTKIGLTQYKLICFIVDKWLDSVWTNDESQGHLAFIGMHHVWRSSVRVIDDRRSTLRTCG